ncbi:hypothetical protein B2J86_07955 [Acidovorax sp. SRB_14]|nr:hypothetical protein [Acidovorax sp. SRB_14]
MAAQDVMDTPVGNRPQWLSQVIKRLVDLAPTHSAAKQAVVIAQDKLVEASPDMASAIKAMVQ